MTDDSASPNDGGDEQRYGKSAAGAAIDRDGESAPASISKHRHLESADALVQLLLVGYGEVLDSIAAKPPIWFASCRSAPEGSFSRRFPILHANFIAAILAEAHIAVRLDALLRRGQRFRALHPRERNLLDLDRLQDFRSSLSPVGRRTLTVWVTLLALAVAFPVAWITDHVRALAPESIVCSSRFSLRAAIVKLVGTSPGPVTTGCRLRSGPSLVEALVRVAHLNLSPGGVIDTFSSVRTSGLVVVLLLTVVSILCLCVVLLAFSSGFRLKRLAFLGRASAAGRARSADPGRDPF